MRSAACSVPVQGPGAIRAVAAGGSVQVDVGPNDRQVEITNAATGERSVVPVPPGKTVSIPVPHPSTGNLFVLRIGTGRDAQVILVEIIDPGP